MADSHDGEQLVLDLRMPWHGVSPRYLTRAFLDRSFGGTGRAIQGIDYNGVETTPDQREDLQLWLFDDLI